MNLLTYILVFLSLVGPSLFLHIKFNWKTCSSLPFVFFVIIILLFFGGILNILKITALIIYVITYTCLLATIIYFILSKEKWTWLKSAFSPGLVIWISLFFFLILFNKNRQFFHWDDFTHWGDIVKSMFLLNNLGTGPDSISFAKSYLPGLALFEYYFQVFTPTFNEGMVFSAYDLFILTLPISFLSSFKWEKNLSVFLKIIICISIILLLPLIFFHKYIYSSVYVDSALAWVFAFSIAIVITTKQFNKHTIFKIMLCTCTLTIIKDLGIVFAIGVILICLFDILFLQSKHFKSKKNMLKLLLPIFILLTAVFIIYFIWKIHMSMNDIPNSTVKDVPLKQILLALFEKSHTYLDNVTRSFIKALSLKYLSIGELKLNFWFSVICFSLFSLYLYYLCNGKNKTKLKIVSILIILGSILYLILILILYMMMFSEEEATNLSSIDRYLSTYTQAFFVLNAYMIFYFIGKKSCTKILIFFLTFCMFTIPLGSFTEKYFDKSHVANERAPYNNVSTQVSNYLCGQKVKMYIISQHNDGYDFWLLKYVFSQNLKDTNKYWEGESWMLGPESIEENHNAWDIKPNQWMDVLINENYDYVYVYNCDQCFVNNYGSLFNNDSDINAKSLYKIDRQTRKLEPVLKS